MKQLILEPVKTIKGEVNIPGSKSISNRALLLATLASGTTRLTNLLDSDDISHMLTALKELGVQFQLSNDIQTCIVEGLGQPIVQAKSKALFLGNAGTAMRPLCAALTLGKGEFILTGEPRMEERPIGDLVDALKQLGAQIDYLKNEHYPPLKITATGLTGGDVTIAGDLSSQFLSALLMVAPLASSDVCIHISGELVSKPYVDLTIAMMKQFGVSVKNTDYKTFEIKSGQKYVSPGDFLVEGDASSASYFLAAGAIAGEVKVTGVGKLSIQGDVKFADALQAMGAEIEWGDDFIIAKKGNLKGIDMDMNHIPDAAMTIATTALFASGETLIRNIHNWRIKETDRLAAMATELTKVGALIEEGNDYIKITPPAGNIKHAAIDTYNDHRMAMCFSLLALSEKGITINDPDCTSKTFPDYFQKFAAVCW